VAWRDAKNVAASPGTLTKNAGGNVTYNAGAISTGDFSEGGAPQYVQFRCSQGSHAMVGFSNGIAGYRDVHGHSVTRDDMFLSDEYALEMPFAINCHDNLRISESNAQKGEFGSWTPNDVFKIQIVDTTVTYLKNDVVLYTSSETPTFPLYVDSLIYYEGAELSDVTACAIPPSHAQRMSTALLWRTTSRAR
jgi:hypothetical protein